MQSNNNSEIHRLLAGNGFFDVERQSLCSSSSYYPLDQVSAISDTLPPLSEKALAALRNHKEAEKKRRERINSHLDRLRNLLPCNSKTDKASLLAKVVQRVKDLKRQASEITGIEAFPSEIDEISVLSGNYSSDGRTIFQASLCCEDRSDLIPDLINILNSLHLKTLTAEVATLGGRIRNVLVVTPDKDCSVESVHFIQNSLKSLLESSNSSERSKRRLVLDRNDRS